MIHKFSLKENAFENAVCNMSAILSRGQLKHLEKHGCILSTVAADLLLLEHQDPIQYPKCSLYWTSFIQKTLANKIFFWKKKSSCFKG